MRETVLKPGRVVWCRWFTLSELVDIDAERTVVTSALPYIHGVPHLGNIVGSMLPADLYHRYLDLRGHENLFICGSDEHGTPLELSALEAGESPETHADAQHAAVAQVLADFDLDFSSYGRTHTPYNRDQTHTMFRHLYQNGYIVEREQQLPYCADCARFLPDRYIEGECPHCGGLARGDQCDDCGKLLEPEEVVAPHCTICGNTNIEFRSTKNLFLDLPAFRDRLKAWLKDADPIPHTEKKQVLNLLDEGLEERCITRDISWGFDVPTDFDGIDAETYADKVLYVWFDAPIGYIGITRQFLDETGDESRWRDYWQDPQSRTIYSIGKDNTIFHTIIFPSILMGGAGDGESYNLPDYEFIHEYLLSEDVQFSKSRGHGLSSRDALELLPADYWRFYLSRVIPENHDSTFSWSDLAAKVNGELNDTVGNYVNRVLTLAEKWFDNTVPHPDNEDRYAETIEELHELLVQYDHAFETEKSPRTALQHALAIARLGDRFLQREEPWHDEEKQADVLYVCLEIVKALAVTLYPFTPNSAATIWRMLGYEDRIVSGDDRLQDVLTNEGRMEYGHVLGERSILFEKVDADALRAATEADTDTTDEDDTMSTISFDEFQKMDLRTATVLSVEDHPNADKLYVVTLDVGGETKQSCAGLKEYFTPEELEGKRVIVVNNLEPAELRGETSECMMLAVDADDDVHLLTTEERVENGLKVR